MPDTIGVLLAEGFEEVEALAVVDVLRRAEFKVVVAGVPEGPIITGAHGVSVSVDANLADLAADNLALLVLPGGMPGSVNLAQNNEVLQLVRDVHELDVCRIFQCERFHDTNLGLITDDLHLGVQFRVCLADDVCLFFIR